MSTPLFKILIFLKRRSGMSSIAFRDYYEGVHSKFGEKYADGLHRYLRRYVEPLADDLVSHAEALDFDVITELWFTDRAAFDLVVKYAAHGRLPPEVIEDEARLFDRGKMRYVTVVERESTLPAS
ncbi:MAG TPA: EthD domain-containing protein [Solimonas sp.]